MSWFSDLANKAEALLEKVDKTAATSLGGELQASIGESNIGEIRVSSVYNGEPIPDLLPGKKTGQKADIPRAASVPYLSQKVTTNTKAPSAPQKESDEMLFEFLNSSSIPATSTRRQPVPKTSTPIKSHSRTVVSKKDETEQQLVNRPDSSEREAAQTLPAQQASSEKEGIEVQSAMESILPKSADVSVIEPTKEDGIKNMTSPVPMKNIASERLSNLELENKLLKGEMASLNEELATNLRKAKELQDELNKVREECSRLQEAFKIEEKNMNLLLDNEKDYKESIKAKDSQLAVLRVRIQEADEELKTKTELLEKVQSENERVLKDHSESAGVQSIALDNMKQKMEEAEENLWKEKEANNKIMTELEELRSKIQVDQQQMALSVKQMQAKLNEEKGKVRELEQQSKNASESADVAQKELKDYRDKATRILQAKEKLITSLKQGHTGNATSPIILNELEDVKQERDLLRDELQQTRYKLEQMRMEIQDLERQHQSESDEQNAENEALQHSLQDEQRRRQQAEEDSHRMQQDLRLTREDMQRQKSYTMSQIQEREDEIKNLRNQIARKSTTSTSQEELENRVRSLTESLIQKQTLVETLSTEKSSLTLQLERLEQQYKDVQQSILKRPQNFRTTGNNFNDVEDLEEGNRLQSIASIMPSPIAKSRHWKSTVNEIDKFSIRLGLFLRRYPIARLFVILYMFILHLWVTIVLLTYQPEIHGESPPGSQRNAVPNMR